MCLKLYEAHIADFKIFSDRCKLFKTMVKILHFIYLSQFYEKDWIWISICVSVAVSIISQTLGKETLTVLIECYSDTLSLKKRWGKSFCIEHLLLITKTNFPCRMLL